MVKRLLVLFVVLLGLSVFTSRTVRAFFSSSSERKIVVFKPEVSREERLSLLSQHQASFTKDLRLINGMAMTIPSARVGELARDPRVLRIDPDVQVFALPRQDLCSRYPWLPWCPKPSPTPTPTPTPTSAPTPTPTPGTQPLPWGIARISADDAWGTSTGAGVKVAVIDTGIDTDHPDLNDNLAGCLNFIQPSKTCEDDNSHGTHVSGIIAAENNSFGVVGVAPNAKIYALKALDSRGSGYLSDVIEGLDWAVVNGIQVVNMSLGTSSDVLSFHEAVQRVYQAGIIQVVAGGNSGPGANTVTYPAKYPEVIAVSATDSTDSVPSWSSRSPEIDLAAPGVNINSTYLSGKYKVLSGTSMSAPHVTGTVALRLYLHPGETPLQIESVLETNTDHLSFDPTLVGAGLVNAYNVVSY